MREEDFELTFELDPSPRAPEPEQAPELAIETEEDAPQPAAPAAEQGQKNKSEKGGKKLCTQQMGRMEQSV